VELQLLQLYFRLLLPGNDLLLILLSPTCCLQDTSGGIMQIAAQPDGGLLVQGSVQGAQLKIESLPGWEDTPWSEGGQLLLSLFET
jgi:hypothetical protein